MGPGAGAQGGGGTPARPQLLPHTSQHLLLFGGEWPNTGFYFIASPQSSRITEGFLSHPGRQACLKGFCVLDLLPVVETDVCVFLIVPMSERHMLFVTGFHKATKKHSAAQPCGLSNLGHSAEPTAPSSLRFLEAGGLGCLAGSGLHWVKGALFWQRRNCGWQEALGPSPPAGAGCCLIANTWAGSREQGQISGPAW